MKEKISVKTLVQEFKDKKIQNNKVTPNGINDFLDSKLEVTPYISFKDKREIAEMVVSQNTTAEYNVKKIDSASEFVGFIVATLIAHTNLSFGQNAFEDYDVLSESGLLEHIIATFKKDFDECNVVLQMVRNDMLADNNLSVVVAKFLDGVLDKLDDFGDTIKDVVEKIDLDKLIGLGLNENEMAKVKSLLNKYVK